MVTPIYPPPLVGGGEGSPKEGETFRHYEVKEGDLIVGDRGYCQRKGIMHVIENQGEVLVRFHSTNLPL